MPAIPLTLGWDAVVSPHTPLWQRSLGVDIVSGFWRPPALHVLLPTGIHGARRRGWCHLSSLQPLSPPALSSKREVSPAKRQQIFPQSLENTIFFFLTRKALRGPRCGRPFALCYCHPGCPSGQRVPLALPQPVVSAVGAALLESPRKQLGSRCGAGCGGCLNA